MKDTQRDKVLKHLLMHHTITDRTADDMYGIRRLAARIHELRNSGYMIETHRKTVRNRYGQKVIIAEYELTGIQDGAA